MERKEKQGKWLKAAIYGAAFIGLSFGLIYLLQYLGGRFDISSAKFAPTAYMVVFWTTLLCNASIIVPVAMVHISVMVAAASAWDPLLVAFVASVAGTLGELTGYYAGYLEKKIVAADGIPGYTRVTKWVDKYGPWAILLVAFQPVLPVDIAGLIAGASKMSLWKFLLSCWGGKFPKYVLFCYFGFGILRIAYAWF